jgi:hypothetical protein
MEPGAAGAGFAQGGCGINAGPVVRASCVYAELLAGTSQARAELCERSECH